MSWKIMKFIGGDNTKCKYRTLNTVKYMNLHNDTRYCTERYCPVKE